MSMSTKIDLELQPKTDLEGIRCEILAGSVMFPKNDADAAWNAASQRAARIIDLYIRGRGLFQQPDKDKKG